MAAEASARRHDPLRMLGQQRRIDARLVVVPLEVGTAGQAHQVAVAGLGGGQQGHVVEEVFATRRAVEPRAGGEVGLHADDRLDPCGARRLVEVDRAVQHTVVGDRHRRLPVRGCGRDQLVHPPSAVEHGELGMDVQMSEAFHGPP